MERAKPWVLAFSHMCLVKNRLIKTKHKWWREPGCRMEMSGCSWSIFWWDQGQSLMEYPRSSALPLSYFFTSSLMFKGVLWVVPKSHSPCGHRLQPPSQHCWELNRAQDYVSPASTGEEGIHALAFLSNWIFFFLSIIRRWNIICQELIKHFQYSEVIFLPNPTLTAFQDHDHPGMEDAQVLRSSILWQPRAPHFWDSGFCTEAFTSPDHRERSGPSTTLQSVSYLAI